MRIQVVEFFTSNLGSELLASCPGYLFQQTSLLSPAMRVQATIKYGRCASATFPILREHCLFREPVLRIYV